MRKLLIAVIVVVAVAGLAAGSEQTEVMAPVRQFVDGFNKGDAKSAVAACADQTMIIDDFPPHLWHGAGACASWASAYEADAKKNGIVDGVVTLGKPRQVDITGDVAYVVVPASFSYKQNGKLVKEAGATFTLVLQKGMAGWRITAWAWAK